MTVFNGLKCYFCGIIEEAKDTEGWYILNIDIRNKHWVGSRGNKQRDYSTVLEPQDFCSKACVTNQVTRSLFGDQQGKAI